jgi:predicted transposase YdaD
MRIESTDRPKVKAECLRLLATLRLDPARTQLISGFVDTYLRLNAQEKRVFEAEIGKLEETEKEGIMQIVTSWMEEGIEQGARQEARSLILRLLTRRVGQLPEVILAQVNELPIEQLEALGEALLDFVDLSDLQAWLVSEVV